MASKSSTPKNKPESKSETSSAKKPAKAAAPKVANGTAQKVNGKAATKPAKVKEAKTQAAKKTGAEQQNAEKQNIVQAAPDANAVAGTTLGQNFGEMVWLLTQSPIHKQLRLADLEWLLMPAMVLNQARVFKIGQGENTQAVGLALWAYLTPEEAAEMNKVGRLSPEHWRHGTDMREVLKANAEGTPIDLTPPELKEGELELWLVDLIVPHATPENKMAEACLSDLLTGPLNGKKLKMQRVDAKTGDRTTLELGGE